MIVLDTSPLPGKDGEWLPLSACNVYFWLRWFLAAILPEWLFVLVVGDLPAAGPAAQLQRNSTLCTPFPTKSKLNQHQKRLYSILTSAAVFVDTSNQNRHAAQRCHVQFSEVLGPSVLPHQTSANHHWKTLSNAISWDKWMLINITETWKHSLSILTYLQNTECSALISVRWESHSCKFCVWARFMCAYLRKASAEEGNTAHPHIERTTSFGRRRVSELCFGFLLQLGFLGKP